MKEYNKKIVSVLLAAAVCGTVLGGCAASEESKNINKDASQSATAGDHAGEKKVEVYIDDQNNPYFYDANGKKMLLFSIDYEDSMAEDGMEEDLTSGFIYDNYDNNGLSFTIPKGWFVEDTYGTPTVYKDADNIDNIDYNNCISIVPANFMLNYDMDKDKKVDKKFITNYFESFVKSGFYSDYKINSTGEGNIGSEKADMYDITVTYDNEDESVPDMPVEQSRTIIYVTKNKNCYVAAIKVPLDDEKTMQEYVDCFKSFTDSIKLPTEEQTKELLSQFEHDPKEITLDDETGDLIGEDEEIIIDNPAVDDDDAMLPE